MGHLLTVWARANITLDCGLRHKRRTPWISAIHATFCRVLCCLLIEIIEFAVAQDLACGLGREWFSTAATRIQIFISGCTKKQLMSACVAIIEVAGFDQRFVVLDKNRSLTCALRVLSLVLEMRLAYLANQLDPQSLIWCCRCRCLSHRGLLCRHERLASDFKELSRMNLVLHCLTVLKFVNC